MNTRHRIWVALFMFVFRGFCGIAYCMLWHYMTRNTNKYTHWWCPLIYSARSQQEAFVVSLRFMVFQHAFFSSLPNFSLELQTKKGISIDGGHAFSSHPLQSHMLTLHWQMQLIVFNTCIMNTSFLSFWKVATGCQLCIGTMDCMNSIHVDDLINQLLICEYVC